MPNPALYTRPRLCEAKLNDVAKPEITDILLCCRDAAKTHRLTKVLTVPKCGERSSEFIRYNAATR